MPDTTFLDWPFFDREHVRFAQDLRAWSATLPDEEPNEETLDDECRALVVLHGQNGWLRHSVTAPYGGARDRLDVRTLCLARETLAYRGGLADFTFAMQGLGAGPITLFGTDAQRRRYLPAVSTGHAISALAMSEADAGSNLGAMSTVAHRDGDGWIIDGEKTWISNAGIASFYVVFARTPELGERAFCAFVVDAGTHGLTVPSRNAITAPHPLGTVRFHRCRVAGDAVVGEPGKGLSIALGTLDVFRSTVGAAALGFARRAFDEAVQFARTRSIANGQVLADSPMTQAKLAEMAELIDASALLVYRSAWTRDVLDRRVTREAAMAKHYATEAAQRVVDHAVQILGARGVVAGTVVERLYRDVRTLRIYEGTSEIQQLVIAARILADAPAPLATEE